MNVRPPTVRTFIEPKDPIVRIRTSQKTSFVQPLALETSFALAITATAVAAIFYAIMESA